MPRPIRVLIADDHAVVRDGLSRILSLESDIDVVAEAADGQAAVELARDTSPHVVLMDISMPKLDGLMATHQIKEVCPDASVIVLTMFNQDQYVLEAVKHGAIGYMLKDLPSHEVVKAVRTASSGGSLLHPEVARKLVHGFSSLSQKRENEDGLPGEQLTAREQEVLAFLCRGLTNQEIGDQLFISEKTVKKHVSSILHKLGARSRSHAVYLALQDEIVTPVGG